MGVGSDELRNHGGPGLTGWCANGTLRSPLPTLFAPPLDLRRSTESIVLQTALREPGYYTAQFFLNARRAPAAPGITFRGKAEILWSVRGNTVRRVISVYSGSSISGAGEHVSITLHDDSFTSFGGHPPVDYPASIVLARGTRASTPQPPTLFAIDELVAGARPPYTVAAGAAINIGVPDDAGVNQVMIQVSQSAGSVAMTGPNDLIGSFSTANPTFNYDFFNRWIPVPSGAEFLNIANRSAVDYRVFPVWGVEG